MMDCTALLTGLYRCGSGSPILSRAAKNGIVLGISLHSETCKHEINKWSFDKSCFCPPQLNPLASQVAAAAAMGSIAGSQVFGNTLSNLQGATGQLVTNAQGQVSAVTFLYLYQILQRKERLIWLQMFCCAVYPVSVLPIKTFVWYFSSFLTDFRWCVYVCLRSSNHPNIY